MIDLSNWSLCLPIDTTGRKTGPALVVDPATYEHPSYFLRRPDGSLMFRAPVDGAVTANTFGPRSELREFIDRRPAAWKLAQGGMMRATLAVADIPDRFDGKLGKMVIGQIHGSKDELIRLYYEGGNVYFKNDRAGVDDSQARFQIVDDGGKTPVVPFGEKFSYRIEAARETLTVDVVHRGVVFQSITRINDCWQSDSLYFKAGVYLGQDETTATGFGKANFFDLVVAHPPLPTV